jgi:hypothetical protein
MPSCQIAIQIRTLAGTLEPGLFTQRRRCARQRTEIDVAANADVSAIAHLNINEDICLNVDPRGGLSDGGRRLSCKLGIGSSRVRP